MPLLIVRNDITEMNVDAIVNTANPLPAVGSGVDRAIYQKAGWMELLKIRREIGELKVSQVAVTPALKLNAKHIIHVVGPRWFGGNKNELELLAACYKNVLQATMNNNCKSVAIPLISTGNYDFPKDLALKIARDTITEFIAKNDLLVYLVVFDETSFRLSKELFDDVKEYIDKHLVREIKALDSYATNTLFGRVANRRSATRRKETELEDRIFYSETAQKTVSRSLDDLIKEIDAGFAETLFRYIDEKGLTDPEVYKAANLDRKLFSKIRKNKSYKPSKNTALALAVALKLNLDETKDFIGKAGYALTHCNKADIIVEYFITKEDYDIFKINEVLFTFDEPILGCNVA